MTKPNLSVLFVGAALAWSTSVAAQPAAPVLRELGMVAQPCPPAPPAQPAVASRALPEPGRASKPSPKGKAYAAFLAREQDQRINDWAWLCRYQAADADIAATARPKVVFMGDSITEGWGRYDPQFFTNGIIDRGISGQTSPQMLVRFYQDVIALRPEAVHIMAGTNDVAGNTGPTSPEEFKNNIRAMVELAQASGIRVILASIPPARQFWWRPQLRPANEIRELNRWLKAYAAEHGATYVDYYALLAGPDGGMRPAFSFDGVHPGTAGYHLMRQAAEAAIAATLQRKAPNRASAAAR